MMPIELTLVILFGILTSLFGLLQLCIAFPKCCVWCRSLQNIEPPNRSDISAIRSRPCDLDGSRMSSGDSFVTCGEDTESSF